MGFVFDANFADLYTSWYKSAHGRALERYVEGSIRRLLDPQPGERVLDIGCGEGNHLLLFNKLGLSINGLDPSPYLLDRARERLGHRCTLKKGTAEDLPFSDNEFDLAVMINTLEFVDDPVEALKEAGRVARRGVFIGVMNHFSWFWFCQKIQGLFKETLFSRARFYNLWELKTYMQQAFGDVPVTWHCVRICPSLLDSTKKSMKDSEKLRHCPFGLFLGISVTMRYWVRTNQHPLKLGLEKAKQPLVPGIGREKVRGLKRAWENEGSLSLRQIG